MSSLRWQNSQSRIDGFRTYDYASVTKTRHYLRYTTSRPVVQR